MNYVVSGSLAITVFCLCLLLRNRRLGTHIIVLIVWHVLLLINFSAIFLVTIGLGNAIWAVLMLSTGAGFLHGPVLLYYLHTITGQAAKWHSKKNIRHLVPCAFVLIAQIYWYLSSGSVPENFYYASSISAIVSIIAYLSSICLVVQRIRKTSRQVLSKSSYTRLSWLRMAVLALIVCAVTFLVSQTVFQLTDLKLPYYGNFYANLVLSLVVVYIQFMGICQAPAFSSQEAEVLLRSRNELTLTADTEVLSASREELVAVMEKEKPFLDPDLNLYGLAETVGISPHNLSATINRGFGVNFFDFINRYRVEEVKAKIRRDEHKRVTLLAIGLDSGFNSKASFNRIFKKIEGITPSEYAGLVTSNRTTGYACKDV